MSPPQFVDAILTWAAYASLWWFNLSSRLGVQVLYIFLGVYFTNSKNSSLLFSIAPLYRF